MGNTASSKKSVFKSLFIMFQEQQIFSKMLINTEKDAAMVQTRGYSAATQSDDLRYTSLSRQKGKRTNTTSSLIHLHIVT